MKTITKRDEAIINYILLTVRKHVNKQRVSWNASKCVNNDI